MNYYNPYFYNIPNMSNVAGTAARTGIFSRLFGGISFGRILSGTERALNFANQAIPLVKQVKPIIGNAKTMFKVMNEFKKQEKPTYSYTQKKENSIKQDNSTNYSSNYTANEPTFFM